ncbi:hypothetical protein L9F63_018543, partial [Diploptera punctata]
CNSSHSAAAYWCANKTFACSSNCYERQSIRSPGLRVHTETGRVECGRLLGSSSEVVLQQQSQSCVSVDPGTETSGLGNSQRQIGLKSSSLRTRRNHAQGSLHTQPHHRAFWRIQVPRVHLQRRGFYDQENGRFR